MLQRVSGNVMEYFSTWDKFDEAEKKYSFETNNPGLQQIYDAVVELGVTDPVVPMWLPEKYELIEFVHLDSPMTRGIFASFSDGDDELVYQLNIFNGEPAHQYYKDDTHYEVHEWDGLTYYINQNDVWWSVVWTRRNIECHLTLACQEETLWKILESIHVTEAD